MVIIRKYSSHVLMGKSERYLISIGQLFSCPDMYNILFMKIVCDHIFYDYWTILILCTHGLYTQRIAGWLKEKILLIGILLCIQAKSSPSTNLQFSVQ